MWRENIPWIDFEAIVVQSYLFFNSEWSYVNINNFTIWLSRRYLDTATYVLSMKVTYYVCKNLVYSRIYAIHNT